MPSQPILAEAIVDHLSPIQDRYHELMNDKPYLYSVLREGALEANKVADDTLSKARTAMGFFEFDEMEES